MIKISSSSAKRLGYSIKGYVFDKSSKIPIPVLEKAKKPVRKRKRNKNRVELIKEGIIYKVNLKEVKND